MSKVSRITSKVRSVLAFFCDFNCIKVSASPLWFYLKRLFVCAQEVNDEPEGCAGLETITLQNDISPCNV